MLILKPKLMSGVLARIYSRILYFVTQKTFLTVDDECRTLDIKEYLLEEEVESFKVKYIVKDSLFDISSLTNKVRNKERNE